VDKASYSQAEGRGGLYATLVAVACLLTSIGEVRAGTEVGFELHGRELALGGFDRFARTTLRP
jgi:hypothetical protein